MVALGECLETQFWRVDNGRVRWLTVDLPQVVELRSRLLPEDSRVRAIGCSVLDPRWLAEVRDEAGVLVTAQRLLMYLAPDEARKLVALCAERFSSGGLVFDVVPRWLVERSRRGILKTSTGYEPPPCGGSTATRSSGCGRYRTSRVRKRSDCRADAVLCTVWCSRQPAAS